MSRKRRTPADEAFLIVRTSGIDVPRGAVVEDHSHPWHQLVYVSSGVAVVTTSEGSWMAPPAWSVWVPSQTRHGIRFAAGSALRTLYLRPGASPGLPSGCRACPVLPLLRELVLRAADLGSLDERDPEEAAIARLIAAEISARGEDREGPAPFTLPQPSSRSLMPVVRLLEENAQRLSAAALARAAGLSVRTLERRFEEETGMSLGQWRQQRGLLRGLEQICSGASIKAASVIAGYRSASAYIAAFRKAFGTSPGRYLQGRTPAPPQG